MGSKGAQKLLRAAPFFLSFLLVGAIKYKSYFNLGTAYARPHLVRLQQHQVKPQWPPKLLPFSTALIFFHALCLLQRSKPMAWPSQIKSISPIICSLPFSSFLL